MQDIYYLSSSLDASQIFSPVLDSVEVRCILWRLICHLIQLLYAWKLAKLSDQGFEEEMWFSWYVGRKIGKCMETEKSGCSKESGMLAISWPVVDGIDHLTPGSGPVHGAAIRVRTLRIQTGFEFKTKQTMQNVLIVNQEQKNKMRNVYSSALDQSGALTQSTNILPSSLAPTNDLASSRGLEGRKTSTEVTTSCGGLPGKTQHHQLPQNAQTAKPPPTVVHVKIELNASCISQKFICSPWRHN